MIVVMHNGAKSTPVKHAINPLMSRCAVQHTGCQVVEGFYLNLIKAALPMSLHYCQYRPMCGHISTSCTMMPSGPAHVCQPHGMSASSCRHGCISKLSALEEGSPGCNQRWNSFPALGQVFNWIMKVQNLILTQMGNVAEWQAGRKGNLQACIR